MTTSDEIFELDLDKAINSTINYEKLYDDEKELSDSYRSDLDKLKDQNDILNTMQVNLNAELNNLKEKIKVLENNLKTNNNSNDKFNSSVSTINENKRKRDEYIGEFCSLQQSSEDRLIFNISPLLYKKYVQYS
jgi:predicted  nucleic acid-binding Zn-ribbon protein